MHNAAVNCCACLQVARDIWNIFSGRFLHLWTRHLAACGHKPAGGAGAKGADGTPHAAQPTSALTPIELFGDKTDAVARGSVQGAFFQNLLEDSLLFGGCVMIRRLVGIAHNADFERIEDKEVRGVCEARALRLGRELAVRRSEFVSIEAVAEAAAEMRQDGCQPCYPIMLSPE